MAYPRSELRKRSEEERDCEGRAGYWLLPWAPGAPPAGGGSVPTPGLRWPQGTNSPSFRLCLQAVRPRPGESPGAGGGGQSLRDKGGTDTKGIGPGLLRLAQKPHKY